MDLERSLNPRDIRQFAIQQVAKLLLNPDDLENNLDPIRRKLYQDKLLIDSQLKIDAQRLIDNVQEGLEKLNSTGHQMERVKQDMQKADKLCFEAQSIISNYGRIRKISIAHRNFEQADKFYQQVQEFQDKWAHVNQLLQEADARFTSFDFNLLPIHYYLHKLEEFRENAVIFMQTDDFDVYSTLNMMFIELDKLVNALDRFLWKVASHLYEIAINGRNHLIVQLVKIVEIEEKTDETLAKSKERIKRIGKHNHHHKQQQQQPQQIQDGFSETEGQRKPKHYRDKLMREVRACVRRRMDAVFAEQERNGQQQRQMGEGDRLNMLTHLVKEDLEFVRDELVGCFPSSYEIFEVFVREYHAVVVEQTDPLVEQPGLLEGGDIVGLLQWARQHQMVMRKELGVPREYLEPPLLGGQEERLSQALLDIICRNVGQWLQNDLAAKTQIFVERAEPPTVYYKYYTMGIPGIVFKILHEQIGLIKESNRAKLLCDFFTQVRVLLGHNHQAWKTIMDRETQRQIKRPEEVAPGLVDYGIALINDQYQCVRETENIAGSLEGSLSRTYQERAAADLEGMKQDFSEVMEFGMDSLVEIVYSDLSEVVEMLFTPAWYKGDLLEPVVKTLEDYCADFEANLNPGVLARLVQKLMERFVVVYLEAAHMNKKVSFKKGEAGNKIRDEMRTASKFFIRFVARATVNEVFKPVEFMVSLIEQPPSVIVIEFLNVKSKFPDVPLQFIEDVLSKRSDASKANFKSVIESLRADANSQANMIVVKPTLFSKLRSYK